MHELRVCLIILGQAIHLRRNHRREQTDAIAVHRKTLASRLHAGTGQRMPLKRYEIVLAVAFVGLHESVLRYIIMRKTCNSHACQSTRNNRRIVHIIDMQRPTIKNIKKKRAITACEGPSQEEKRQIKARSPKIAVPTRTIVDPSAIASSMSPVIPIDSSRQDCVPGSPDSRI